MRVLHDVAPMVEIRSEIQRIWGVKSLGRSLSAWSIFCEKAVWFTSVNGDGRAEKPRYDVPQGVGVNNRFEAELTNQHRGSGSKIWLYCAVPHGGAEWLRYTAFCRLSIINRYHVSYLRSNIYCCSIAPTLQVLGALGSGLSLASKNTKTKRNTRKKNEGTLRGTLVVHVTGIRYQALNAEKDPNIKKWEEQTREGEAREKTQQPRGGRHILAYKRKNRRKEGMREKEQQPGDGGDFSANTIEKLPPQSHE